MSDMWTLFEPGMLVQHPDCTEWGIGQVQSNIGGRVTVNFQHEGKVVIDARLVELVIIYDP